MNRFVSICILLAVQMTAIAQTIQKGFVKEYNEELEKTPLENVELVVTNAGTTVSDPKGAFTLNFRTLSAGNHVSVRRIEKLGYEVFNKDALEQWNINPDEAFTIVMCRSDRFKRIRDSYNKVSSESYARQLAVEEAVLTELYDNGKLQREEYEDSLKNLKLEYEQQLETIDTYVDRFARIDLSELSDEEFEIIKLVRVGNITEAIKKYETMGLVDKYRQEVDDIKAIDAAVDKLEALRDAKDSAKKTVTESVIRQANAYYLAGGKDNHNKIEILLEEFIKIDTTNIEAILFYADYLQTQNKPHTALRYYQMCQDYGFGNDVAKGFYQMDLSSVYFNIGDFELAENWAEAALHCFERTSEGYLKASHNLATIYTTRGKYTEAESILDNILNEVESRGENEYTPSFNAIFYHTYANVYYKQRRFEEALEMSEKSIRNVKLLKPTEQTSRIYVGCLTMLGGIKNFLGDYNAAVAALSEAAARLEISYQKNPSAYITEYYVLLTNLGVLYFNMSEFALAKETFLKEIELLDASDRMEVQTRDFVNYNKAVCYNNLGYLHYVKGDYVESVGYYIQSLAIYEILYEKYPEVYRIEVARTGTNISGSYLQMGRLDDAIAFGDDAIGHYIIEYETNPQGCREAYALALKYKAGAFVQKGDKSSLALYDKALEIAPESSQLCAVPDILDAKGCAYLKFGKGNLAKKVYRKVAEYYPEYYTTRASGIKDLFAK